MSGKSGLTFLFVLIVIILSVVSCAPSKKIITDGELTYVIFEDFEKNNYSGWKAEGKAFGDAPQTGAFPNQSVVSGFKGRGLVNSYNPNDSLTGKLTSEKFDVKRRYIGFLIGGGSHNYDTCINLVVGGKIVRTRTGQNNEYLKPAFWDVSEFVGKEAYIEIIDNNTQGWGHINIDHIIFSDVTPRDEWMLPYKPMLKADKFVKIYDPSIGEKENWYINDHTFIYGPDKNWHLFGITHAEPANPEDEDNFAHAISPSLTKSDWKKLPFALSVDWDKWHEIHLWAPHVIWHDGLYYMFYCAGDPEASKYKIHLATSSDLMTWTRHPKNPMVVDGCYARDPNIIKIGDEFVMYYTATDPNSFGRHCVAYRTSKNLIEWGERKVCFRDSAEGCAGGETESPFVVRRGEYYYLFIGPRGGYVGTDVFRSKNPFDFRLEGQAGHIDSHALEVIRDKDGRWYVSACGWGQGGVYIAPLIWLDGENDSDSSM